MADNAQAFDHVVDSSCRLQPGDGAADESGARVSRSDHGRKWIVLERERFEHEPERFGPERERFGPERRDQFGPNTRSASGDDLHVIPANADLRR
jgi:hypothetical protein